MQITPFSLVYIYTRASKCYNRPNFSVHNSHMFLDFDQNGESALGSNWDR